MVAAQYLSHTSCIHKMSTSGREFVTVSFFDKLERRKFCRKYGVCCSSFFPELKINTIIHWLTHTKIQYMPINFDLAMGFPLLFHLEKVSFANKTLQVAKVNTFLLVSLLAV